MSDELKPVIEALIFASPDPLTPKMLFKLLESEPKEDVEAALEALKRELREEIDVEVETAKIFTARSFRKPRQVEVLFLCRITGAAKPRTMEVERAEWFSIHSLPDGLPRDQRLLVERAAKTE